MQNVRYLKQHLESTIYVPASQCCRLCRCWMCLLAKELRRMKRGTRILYKQADKLASPPINIWCTHLVWFPVFCSSPAASCPACLWINEVDICLKGQLVLIPKELLVPAWWRQKRCQQPGRWWQIKRTTSHRGSGDFLTNMLIHTLVDWLTLPKYLSFTAMFGHDFIATLVVCDLAHFMHELLWLLPAALLLTTNAGLAGLTSDRLTSVFTFSVRNKSFHLPPKCCSQKWKVNGLWQKLRKSTFRN